MNWLIDNWIWIAVALGFLAMHFFGHGHGGHGSGHGRRGHGDANSRPQSPEAQTPGTAQPSEPDRAAHNHGSGTPGLRRDAAAVATINGAATRERSTQGRHDC